MLQSLGEVLPFPDEGGFWGSPLETFYPFLNLYFLIQGYSMQIFLIITLLEFTGRAAYTQAHTKPYRM